MCVYHTHGLTTVFWTARMAWGGVVEGWNRGLIHAQSSGGQTRKKTACRHGTCNRCAPCFLATQDNLECLVNLLMKVEAEVA